MVQAGVASQIARRHALDVGRETDQIIIGARAAKSVEGNWCMDELGTMRSHEPRPWFVTVRPLRDDIGRPGRGLLTSVPRTDQEPHILRGRGILVAAVMYMSCGIASYRS